MDQLQIAINVAIMLRLVELNVPVSSLDQGDMILIKQTMMNEVKSGLSPDQAIKKVLCLDSFGHLIMNLHM